MGDIINVLKRWPEEGFERVSCIGEAREIISWLQDLKDVPGFEALHNSLGSLISRSSPEEVWEQIEHDFAVAKEASYYKKKGYKVELEETLGSKDQSKPDFRVFIDDQWTYFEIKVSSMFPGEKYFLDKVLKPLKQELSSICFPWKYCVVLKYREGISRAQLQSFIEGIRHLRQQISSIPRDEVGDIYAHPTLPVGLIFLKSHSVEVFGSLLEKCMDAVDFINIPMVVNQTVRNGYYIIALDERISKYRGDIFCPTETHGMLIGRLSEKFEKTRSEMKLREALGKAPQNEPYVVVFFSRGVILGKLAQATVYDVFRNPDFSEISELILDVATETGPERKQVHQRQTFKNPNWNPLSSDRV